MNDDEFTQDDFRKLIKKGNLSTRGTAGLIGISQRSVFRYLGGHKPIPKSVGLALQQALDAGVPDWAIQHGPGPRPGSKRRVNAEATPREKAASRRRRAAKHKG